jgi:hypothetical protein
MSVAGGTSPTFRRRGERDCPSSSERRIYLIAYDDSVLTATPCASPYARCEEEGISDAKYQEIRPKCADRNRGRHYEVIAAYSESHCQEPSQYNLALQQHRSSAVARTSGRGLRRKAGRTRSCTANQISCNHQLPCWIGTHASPSALAGLVRAVLIAALASPEVAVL